MQGRHAVGSGYRAMEHCDALVMLGTDFPCIWAARYLRMNGARRKARG